MEFDFSKEPGKALLDRGLINDGDPLISIITPYYNAGKYFEQTFNCVMNQTFPYFEWIIVNDGSTNQDDVEILLKYSGQDSRIRVYHKQNGGISTARNLAINKSTTDIIITLDADDLIEPTYIECIYLSMQCNPEASWCYSDNIGFFQQEYLWSKPFDSNLLKDYNFLTYSAGIRKNALIEIGLYSEIEKHYYEDWTAWLKLLAKGKFPIHMKWYGFWYRRTDGGVLGAVRDNTERHERAMRIICEEKKHVKNVVTAIEYPRNTKNNFQKPLKWEWNKPPILKNNKKKVLMLIPHMEMGGADVFNLDIISKIDKMQYELSIIATNSSESSWRQRFEQHVTDIFDLSSFLDIKDWSAFIHYFIKSRQIDILFVSNSYYGYYLIPWIRKEFPNIAIVDYIHMEEWYWRSGGYARTSGAVGDILEKTYVCSEHLRRIMIERFGKKAEDVETLYIGVDEDDFNCNNVEEGKIKEDLGIGGTRPLILFPCRIHPQKRPFLMVEIAKEARKKVSDICFVVVGDGPQYEELKTYIGQNDLKDTIYLAGRHKDLKPYYRDSDITLICSIKEGLSLTSYESLSMGVPVITSDVGGQKELISHEVGRVLPLLQDEESDFDCRDYRREEIDQYVKAIIEILENKEKYSEMRKKCRRRIEEDFTKKQMIERLEKDFDEIVSGGGKERRQQLAASVMQIPNLIDDYLTIYCEYHNKDMEAEEIWKARTYFKELAEKFSLGNNSKYLGSAANDWAINELQEIYKMRTFRLIKKYQRFMDRTRIGRLFCKVRDLVL